MKKYVHPCVILIQGVDLPHKNIDNALIGLDGSSVVAHNVQRYPPEIPQPQFHILLHHFQSLPFQSHHKVRFLKVPCDFFRRNARHSLLQIPLPKILIEAFQPHSQAHFNPRKEFSKRGDLISYQIVRLEMQHLYPLFPNGLPNKRKRLLSQFMKRPAVDDFQIPVFSSHLLQNVPVQSYVRVIIRTRVQMIIAEGALLIKAPLAPKEHYLPRVFFPNYPIPKHGLCLRSFVLGYPGQDGFELPNPLYQIKPVQPPKNHLTTILNLLARFPQKQRF